MRHFFDTDPFHPNHRLSLHWRASAIRSIWQEILFFTAFAAAITILQHKQHHTDLAVASTILTVFGTVLGFVISYRTSSAYDRYWEGRRMWSDIVLTSRTLARLIWLHVPNYINVPKDPNKIPEDEAVKSLIEKKTMINLIEAFAVATKHYLRGEQGPYYEDLWHLISFLPKYHLPSAIPPRADRNVLAETISNASQTQKEESNPNSVGSSMILKKEYSEDLSSSDRTALRQRIPSNGRQPNGVPLPPQGKTIQPAMNPPPFSILDDVFPFLIPFKIFFTFIYSSYKKKFVESKHNGRRGRKRVPLENENIPLEITVIFSSYVAALQRRKTIDAPTVTTLLASVLSLSTSLSALERILTTPIPAGYAIHLKHVVYLYLIILPFQLLSSLKWLTIPATGILSFCFLGLLEIGSEIENPFGYDHNDLNLDYFCARIIHRELTDLTSHTPESQAPEAFVFTSLNVPFVGVDTRNAEEILQAGVGKKEVERTFSRLEMLEDGESLRSKGRKMDMEEGGGDDGVGAAVGGSGADAGDG